MHGWGTRERMHSLMYLVQGGGKTVLINTGPPADLTRINRAWRDFFGYDEAQIQRAEHERPLNALALLASGNQEYHPLIQREAKWAADFTTDGYLSWYYGNLMTFLSEYVMTTDDTSVMPGLKRLALETELLAV